MPYGFIKHIEEKGYSSETIRSYERVVTQFFAYIKSFYPDNKEPFQISSSDIKGYLKHQSENEKSVSTINKELAIIKTMFHYFWERDKVPVDPAVKIKRWKVKDKPSIEVPYETIELLLEKVLDNPGYSELRKAVFILASKGLKTSDFRFKKGDVTDNIYENTAIIQLNNRILTLEGSGAATFLGYYNSIALTETDYVFTTKPHGSETLGPVEVMSILNHLRAISEDYKDLVKQPLTLVSMRRAYAFNLYEKKVPIQEIAQELGIEESSASSYLKLLLEGKLIQKSS
ncbi:integrase [Fictibacillus phosphorivorans]|uniref:Integrase n=1 Tax=Fictibacillus phosphorivorans TaxID=1221500 RepID=A0A165NX95_9BACL|nr:phage integrase N-terminal SAM-like domain-containing protein [Fictibacillus phosphorivorans]KZE68025.1 integrase [Fictibacillus phosphorivorans]